MMHVGDNIKAGCSQWNFGGTVVKSFDDHVSKSVPLYHEGHDLIINFSDYFIRQGTACYDIGSSTGSLTYKLATKHKSKSNVDFIGLEKEVDMIKYAKEKYYLDNLSFLCSDIVEEEIQPCSYVVSYYLLQFIEEKHRQEVINKIYNALIPGGAFILFEKVYAENGFLQDVLNGIYFDFKEKQGFSHAEIIAKAQSIRGVLNSQTSSQNIAFLKESGFNHIAKVLKYCNFEGYLAVK